MLSDRDYMHRRQRPRRGSAFDDDPYRIIWLLIAVNVGVFILTSLDERLSSLLSLTIPGIQNFQYWRLITSIFVHGGLMHLLFNMYGVYLFGTLVTPHIGTRRFLGLFFISGILGNVLWMLANWSNPGFIFPATGQYYPYQLVGASGGVFGIMLAAAMLEPHRQFLLLIPPIPLKCRTLVVVYGLIEVLFAWNGSNDNIAHLAHLGGMLGGYAFLKMTCNHLLRWDIMDIFKSKRRGGYTPPQRPAPPPPPQPKSNKTYDYNGSRSYDNKTFTVNSDKPVSRKELDRLLDKISYHGINSLTPEEQATLKRAREQMKNR
jgi:membrane associated rhomboid family serine protease